MVEADAILAAEGIITIALSLVILAVGIKRLQVVRSDEARQRFVENWNSFRLAMFLIGGSILLFLLATVFEVGALQLPGDMADELGDMGEVIHMFLLVWAMGISARITMQISRGNP